MKPFVFTNWICGGGTKSGTIAGESDPWGYKPFDRANPTEVYDIHATILHLLGIDHTKLTHRSNGVDRSHTVVHGHVIQRCLSCPGKHLRSPATQPAIRAVA